MEEKLITEVEVERSNFRSLLTKNLNYFGNLPESKLEAVKKIVVSTKYEEITCVGFNPVKNLLEATIAVKLPFGYGGNLCGPGTREYVRFFADYGSGWEDIGLTGVNVHDIPNGMDCEEKPDKPLMYVATLKFTPKRDCCNRPVLPRIRAILSWQWIPPAGPANVNWQPPWGNALECNVQIQPLPWNTIFCLLKNIGLKIGQKIEVPFSFEQAKYVPICLPEPPLLTLAEKAEMYTAKIEAGEVAEKGMGRFSVEPHRFGVEDLHAALAVGGIDQESLNAKIEEWKALDIDWFAVIAALDETKANVSYEELECLGMDNVIPERLVATFRIKKNAGYSGDLCKPGSVEYVAFWADWDNTCQWKYLNTVKINVHDIPEAAQKGGLCYSAILPVDLTYLRRNCEKPKIARIRAVLSWNVPPSTTDPDALNYWGNRLDAHVLISPGETVDPKNPKANIRNIGGIPVEDIYTSSTGLTKPSAKFGHYPYLNADEWNLGRPCPFGGRIIIEGNYYLGYYYRVRVRKHTDPTTTIMTVAKDFYVERADVGYDHQVADTNGWFEYLDPLQEFGRTLALWDSLGDDRWEVQLQIATAPLATSIIASSPWYRIQLDNTKPIVDIHIAAGGDCKDFDEGDTVSGTFVADDLHFGKWGLATLPNNPPTTPSNQPVATPFLAKTSPAPAPAGHGWTLDTNPPPYKMKPCGYAVRLEAWDRTIRASVPWHHNWDHIEVGFCLREKKT